MQQNLELVMKQFQADTGTVHIVEGGVLVLKAHVGVPHNVLPMIARVPVGKGMAGSAFHLNSPVKSCDIQADQNQTIQAGARQTGVNGAIVVPIRDRMGNAIGALGIGVHREYVYSDEEISTLVEVAASMGSDREADT